MRRRDGWAVAAMLAAAAAGMILGALIDESTLGASQWRTLCLVPGWPGLPQLLLKLELMPATFAGMAGGPLLLLVLAPARSRGSHWAWSCLSCQLAVPASMPLALFGCRWLSAVGLPLNASLPAMLGFEWAAMAALAALIHCLAVKFWGVRASDSEAERPVSAPGPF